MILAQTVFSGGNAKLVGFSLQWTAKLKLFLTQLFLFAFKGIEPYRSIFRLGDVPVWLLMLLLRFQTKLINRTFESFLETFFPFVNIIFWITQLFPHNNFNNMPIGPSQDIFNNSQLIIKLELGPEHFQLTTRTNKTKNKILGVTHKNIRQVIRHW